MEHIFQNHLGGRAPAGKSYFLSTLINENKRRTDLSTHIIVVFKNPRDSLGINTLAGQAFLNAVNYIMESFKDAIEKPYSYILIDLHALTPENYRLRTMIFPGEQQIAYVKHI